MMKSADSLTLSALLLMRMAERFGLRELFNVSGSVHIHDEICGQSQTVCTCPHANGGTSRALCTSTMQLADNLRLFARLLMRTTERLKLYAHPR